MSISETISKHPMAIMAGVIAVAIIAWLVSRQSSSSATDQGATFTGAGGSLATTDPNAAAIQEAQIQAGAQNLGILASLISSTKTTAAQQAVAEDQITAGRDVAIRQSSDALTASLAQTSAALQTSLAQTSAAQEVADSQTAAGITVAGINAKAASDAASITKQIQDDLFAEQEKIAQLNLDYQNNALQTQKDIARAGDNTSIVNKFISFGEDVVNIFNPFKWKF